MVKEMSEEEWQVQSDWESLCTAYEIMEDASRMKKALAYGEKKKKTIEKTLDEAKVA